jgi:hypothetical protein
VERVALVVPVARSRSSAAPLVQQAPQTPEAATAEQVITAAIFPSPPVHPRLVQRATAPAVRRTVALAARARASSSAHPKAVLVALPQQAEPMAPLARPEP